MTLKLLSTQDLAQYLGVPVATLYRWSYMGEGPPRMRVGRYLRYRQVDVDSWLNSRRSREA